MSSDGQIDVYRQTVRHALARAFNGIDPGDHAWRGTMGLGEAEVIADVALLDDGRPYLAVYADIAPAAALDGSLARMLVMENANTTIGRLVHRDGAIRIEHAILAGTTMANVEIKASVWTVGWTAHAFAPRIAALTQEATPVPHVPELPAALRRDAADHVTMTTARVQRFLEQHYGPFQHDPNWGFHGPFGSARVFVDVLPVLEDSTAVRASSPVLSDVDLTDELALRLLELSDASPFGAYSYLPSRREAWFEHVILGDDLDPVELETAIDTVATTADGEDDELAERFGGRRYADLG
jgi:hypothetical protein